MPSASGSTKTTHFRPPGCCWISTTSCVGWNLNEAGGISPSRSHPQRLCSNGPGTLLASSGRSTRSWRSPMFTGLIRLTATRSRCGTSMVRTSSSASEPPATPSFFERRRNTFPGRSSLRPNAEGSASRSSLSRDSDTRISAANRSLHSVTTLRANSRPDLPRIVRCLLAADAGEVMGVSHCPRQ